LANTIYLGTKLRLSHLVVVNTCRITFCALQLDFCVSSALCWPWYWFQCVVFDSVKPQQSSQQPSVSSHRHRLSGETQTQDWRISGEFEEFPQRSELHE